MTRSQMAERLPSPTELDAPQAPPVVDRAAFAALVEEHQDRLRGFLYRYTRSRQDAEDLAQDTFVKAFRAYHRYDPRYSFATWLYTIARRTAYNHFRDAKPTQELAFDLAEAGPSPDERAAQGDERSWVWEAAKRLKPEFREALVLKYVEDLSIEDIARVLKKSKTNVKIILFRARNALKAMQRADFRKDPS